MLIIIFLRWRFMVCGAFCGYKKSTECRLRLAGGGGVKAAETCTAHALAPTHGIWDGE